MIQIIFEGASVSKLLSVNIPFDSLSFLVFPLVSILFIPLLSLSVNSSAFELPVLTLGLCYDGSNSMRDIILEESEIVKPLTIQFSITFLFPFHKFSSVV